MRIPLFYVHLCYGTIPHIFTSHQFLPNLIYKLEQPFTEQTPILYIYILNIQPSLISWLANNAIFCQSVFLFMLIALPVKLISIKNKKN
jgi:hypothetical protein